MKKSFLDLIAIARENVQKNPKLRARTTQEAVERYVNGRLEEVEEVKEELKENNEVHLVDELSDIAWDYAVLLCVLENRGLISDVEDVIAHAHEKYTQRTPAFLEASSELWEEIKVKQKAELARRHQEKYGN